jgi:SAM-dependent methyltransferase
VDTSHLPEQHVFANRAAWDGWAAGFEANGEQNWQSEPAWGIWGIPEAELNLLPDVAGLDTIELGCGTAYVSAWLARRGARVTGIDNSTAQLDTARRLQAEHGLHFPLIHGDAEHVPLPDNSFDLAISEYGASIWCDPYRWIPEAARLLRPGGQLIFLVNGTFLVLCMQEDERVPADPVLLRDYFSMHRFEWPDTPGIDFHLGYGDWIRLLHRHDFEVENLLELRPAPNATTTYQFVTLEWARRWPSEEVWIARKRA